MLQSKPIRFLHEAISELKKVVWPAKEQVVRLTLIVIVVSVIAGLLMGGLDFIFTKLLALII
ncbi:preprotein translocase subunit SecE [Candidatus Beckwithbacteria bacterium CG22_combo_CG10-13_8_21_14_all_01_47_9]|uniref:Protein translocase subunit SecE n=5 Tax=Candidatus Beckwithiibacteriota TaxID=1752726 RepID=A0A2H0E026_9BACT|nr:MAG: preprotein translocase subunit SecE [Candidatus Beckwithbacteria bacterium CG1_02_47_37]PIP52579.1 MAG: preprotein translocase subunit SecE [Candidatus Beckwithbacteria bacterium CG23_combo_of_CG06-09_8_20_14_all_47_9]PIP87488.1 MAG: preprotein translocase subunit SecE [Candidatus Beckwithbacteria bacterium CG22_combo_CG10-13_8_21_14_all_01_47_9]PJA22345.1 MAG: preprotein translocase subunit SecE [Candidatus Beckwithbacteria bacterium CG_4_10_14_0_2_um_filter_47_25]PJC66169.1 MAG: prepr